MEKKKALIVDQDDATKKIFRSLLNKDQFRIFTAADEEEALPLVKRRCPELVVLDLSIKQGQAIEFLSLLKEMNPNGKIIALGRRAGDNEQKAALKLGVSACLMKPLTPSMILETIDRLWQNETEGSDAEMTLRPIVGSSPKLRHMMSIVHKVADSAATVLVHGKSGTGKELVARALHYYSFRRRKPYVTVNCAALPDGLLESELFGVRQGAFTGATANRDGKMQLAHGGTLVLDEISELPLKLQAKLLRALQEKEVTPLGGKLPQKVDVRVVAVTNRDLRAEVREGRFREDLYYRLNVIGITPPTLRERKEDIPELVQHFIARFNQENRRHVTSVSDDVQRVLSDYHWPGNIRELENALEKAVVLSEGNELHLEDLPGHIIESVGTEEEPPSLFPFEPFCQVNSPLSNNAS